MNGLKKYLAGMLVTTLILVGVSTVALAQEPVPKTIDGFQNTALPEVVNKTVYRAGYNVNVDNIVNGDLYCFGHNVVITAVVDGDVMCAGNNITISGSVNGDIRVTGKAIELTGDVGGNATVIAKDFYSSPDSVIENDATIIGTQINLNGEIGRDVNIRADGVEFSGNVGRDVQSYHQSFMFDGDAIIGGNFKYSSPSTVNVPTDAVNQETVRTYGGEGRKNTILTSSVFIAALLYIAWFVSLLVMVLGVAFLFPKSLDDSVEFANKQPWVSVLAGLLTILVAPPIIAILFVSIIGIPLGLIMAFIFGIMVLLSGPFVAHYIGTKLFPTRSHPVRALGGAVILLLFYVVPVINVLTAIAVAVFGVGLVARVLTQRYSIAHRDYHAKKK